MKGASASLARRREISVLPQPVGPIIRIFLGLTSSRSSGASCWLRQRFLSATATARLAASWPMICVSSAATIALGVRSLFMGSSLDIDDLEGGLVVGIDEDVGEIGRVWCREGVCKNV